MEIKERKYFGDLLKGHLDSDSSDFVVGIDAWINGENIRSGSTDDGSIGGIEAIGSTTLIGTIQPSNTFIFLGGAEDIANNRFCYFLCNTTGIWHKIMCYDYESNTIYTVLTSAQVTDGLNFSKDYFIHSARVVNGLLFWTDNLNQPRRINIDAGINLNHPNTISGVAAYTSPLAQNVITIIRKPCNFPLVATKVSPAVTTNVFANFTGKFAVQYEFRDGEISVPSPLSNLINYNKKSDTYTAADLALPFSEIIPQDVQKVFYLAQSGFQPDLFIIKIWDKENSTDLAAIEAHNAGTTALTYRFYNNQTGIPIGATLSVKPYDSVPTKSETLEIVNNKLFLGRNVEGNTAPNITSLTGAFQTQTDGSTVTAQVWKLQYDGGGTTKYVIDLVGVATPGFYRYTPSDGIFPPNPVAFTDLAFVGAGATDVFRYYVPTWPSTPITSFVYTGSTVSVNGISPTNLIGLTVYKSAASYKIGIWFYDRYMRRCGVVVNNETYTTADRTYDTITYSSGLTWTLSNANAVNEIPDWAECYTVGRTRCLRALSFMESRCKNANSSMTYVNKDASGKYTFATSSYASTLVGIAVDITNLSSFGMGYVFSEGDIIKIYKNGDSNVYSLNIIAQEGRWVICELRDLGTLDFVTDAFFEIYTPYVESFNEFYYEMGKIYSINNAGTSARQYSILSDTIAGDVVLLNRGTAPADYLTENMSPNDTYWKNWFTQIGRPNQIDTIGQRIKSGNISWSNSLIPGTRTNGLSSFDPLDEKNLPEECGVLRKLQLTSKVQAEKGSVMLAICEEQTVSLYMGEVQQYGSSESTTLTLSTQVIGSMNVLKGNYGTLNPESVVEYRGSVFYLDRSSGRYIRYSSNGLYPISNDRATRFWKLFCAQYNAMTSAQIEALGGRPFVFSVVDPAHDELLISIPKLLSNPPKGYLPDYPSTIYPFDIWDGQAKTMVYKLSSVQAISETNHWQGSITFYSEGFITLQNRLYSFRYGNLYVHNSTTSFNNFYGVQYQSKIMFVSNAEPSLPKVYNNIAVESNLRPKFTYLYNNYPVQQATELQDFDYNSLEGIWYATIFRNKLIPTATGFATTGMLTGEKMRGSVMYFMLQFSPTTTQLELKFVIVGAIASRGHRV